MARSPTRCPVCGNSARLKAGATADHIVVDCREFGHFGVSEPFKQTAKALTLFNKRLALNHARDRARYGLIPIITNYDLP